MSLDETIKSLGVKKTEVAEAVGARPETLSRWLSGTNAPTSEHASALLDFLNRPQHLKKLGRKKPFTFPELFEAA